MTRILVLTMLESEGSKLLDYLSFGDETIFICERQFNGGLNLLSYDDYQIHHCQKHIKLKCT